MRETLEEVIERLFRYYPESSGYIKAALIGKEWQQERSYSEEDIKLAFEEGFNVCRCVTDNIIEAKECFNEWYNRFKKK